MLITEFLEKIKEVGEPTTIVSDTCTQFRPGWISLILAVEDFKKNNKDVDIQVEFPAAVLYEINKLSVTSKYEEIREKAKELIPFIVTAVEKGIIKITDGAGTFADPVLMNRILDIRTRERRNVCFITTDLNLMLDMRQMTSYQSTKCCDLEIYKFSKMNSDQIFVFEDLSNKPELNVTNTQATEDPSPSNKVLEDSNVEDRVRSFVNMLVNAERRENHA